jgi:hypothetical protein
MLTIPKRKSVTPVEFDKRKCKFITLNTKLEIIKQFDDGQSKANISRVLSFSKPTISLTLSESNEYIQLLCKL